MNESLWPVERYFFLQCAVLTFLPCNISIVLLVLVKKSLDENLLEIITKRNLKNRHTLKKISYNLKLGDAPVILCQQVSYL